MKPITENTSPGAQAIVFALVVLIGGALFPFRTQMSEMAFQLVLIPLSVVFLFFVMVFFWPDRPLSGVLKKTLYRISPDHQPLILIVAFLVLSFGLMLYENRLFGEFGYNLAAPTAIVSLLLLICITFSLRFAFRGKYLAIALLLSLLVIQLLSISSFPLHHARSDMLLLIRSAGERFLAGDSPYSRYAIHESVMLTYLPGLWLTYLPSILLRIDVRFTNVICLAVALVVFLRTCKRLNIDRRSLAFAAVFFLNPWLGFRHEVYIPVFLLQLSLCFSFLLQNRVRASILIFSWSLCSYQYSWVVFPLFLVMLYRVFGKRFTAFALVSAASAVLLLIVPFLLWAPDAMAQGVLGAWSDVYQIETYNLSFWILQVLPLQYIKLLQIVLVITLYVLAFPRIRDISSFLLWSTLATLLFTLTSQLIWHYFFLIPPLYMLFYAVSPVPSAGSWLAFSRIPTTVRPNSD